MNLNRNDVKFDHKLFSFNLFPHLMWVPREEVTLQYLTIRNIGKVYEPKLMKDEVFAWLSFLRQQNGKFGEFIYAYVDSIWQDVEDNIKSFTSLNIHVEGNMPAIGVTKTRMLTHIHPGRLGKPDHKTLTYITSAYQENDPTAYFNYADYDKIGYTQRTQEAIMEGCANAGEAAIAWLNEYNKCGTIPGLEWQKRYLPGTNETLRMKFLASRYPHSVEATGTEIFVMPVFNDVEFYEPLNEDGMHFDMMPNIL
jgi:hypothetical protein